MNGMVFAMVMMACSAGTSVPERAAQTVVPGTPAIHRADEAGAGLKLPRQLVAEEPRSTSRFESLRVAQASPPRRSSRTARVVGTAVGALGGFWAGGAVGYYATQESADDDGVSGLRGVVIGAPIGAALGALLGYRLAR